MLGGLPALESLKTALDELQPGLFQLQLIPPWAGDGFSCPGGRKGVFFPASLSALSAQCMILDTDAGVVVIHPSS